jgi:hypothetical protein
MQTNWIQKHEKTTQTTAFKTIIETSLALIRGEQKSRKSTAFAQKGVSKFSEAHNVGTMLLSELSCQHSHEKCYFPSYLVSTAEQCYFPSSLVSTAEQCYFPSSLVSTATRNVFILNDFM